MLSCCCLFVQLKTHGNCRYEGQFQNGKRHGYGALHYATGARYEGQWQLEQKHGRGVFMFEDGTVFEGMFAHDQPVLKEGQPWGPVGPGVKLRVHDLLEGRDNQQVPPVLWKLQHHAGSAYLQLSFSAKMLTLPLEHQVLNCFWIQRPPS